MHDPTATLMQQAYKDMCLFITYRMPEHICPKCNLNCGSPSALAKHLNRKYPCDKGKYECDLCNHKFQTWESRYQHKKTCTGREPTKQELIDANADLQNAREQSNQQLEMVQRATSAASQHIINNITNNTTSLCINVNTLNVHNSIGNEDVNIKKWTLQEVRNKLTLAHHPSTIAKWCSMVRANEAEPQNHNVLLLDKNSKEIACCIEGAWQLADRCTGLLQMLGNDAINMYNQLRKFEGEEDMDSFRFDYLTKDIMAKTSARDVNGLKKVLDAISEPLINLTQKLYAEKDTSEQAICLKQQEDVQCQILSLHKQMQKNMETQAQMMAQLEQLRLQILK